MRPELVQPWAGKLYERLGPLHCLHLIHSIFQTFAAPAENLHSTHNFQIFMSKVLMNQGHMTAVSGGTGTQSTPANNVGGERRVANPPDT
jgi:hypothetical protein